MSSESETSLPPGPDAPGWVQAQQWIEDPVEFWTRCQAQFGDTFTVRLGSLGDVVVFSNPADVRQIFQLSADGFECRQYNEQYKYVMGGQSILVSDGMHHRTRRRLLMSALHRLVMAKAPEVCRRLTGTAVESWPEDRPIEVRTSLHLLLLENMLEMVLGERSDALRREIIQVFRDEVYKDLGTWGPWRRFGRLQPRLKARIGEEVSERRDGTELGSEDLFEVLIRSRDEAGALLEPAEIADHVFTLLVAGVDTTAIALSWALYWVSECPQVVQGIRDELSGAGGPLTAEQIPDLPYLSGVCNEVLRMYPVVTTPTGRKLTTPAQVGGRRFDAGVTLLPCTYLIHHRAELYPDPGRFNPRRFLDKRFGPHEYLPFGGGNRTCIGATLAPVQLKIALATILSRRDVRPAHLDAVRPVRHGTLLAPSESMRIILSRETVAGPSD